MASRRSPPTQNISQRSTCKSKSPNPLHSRILVSYCCPDADPDTLGVTDYSLFALTVHQGTINNGHYVAYAKRYNKWHNFNDEYYEAVSERVALGQEAYLLFYKQNE